MAKTGKNSFCFLRDNESLRYAIGYQISKEGHNIKDLADQIPVDWRRLYIYLDPKPHDGGRPSLTQRQLLKLAEILGIDVKIDVSLK